MTPLLTALKEEPISLVTVAAPSSAVASSRSVWDGAAWLAVSLEYLFHSASTDAGGSSAPVRPLNHCVTACMMCESCKDGFGAVFGSKLLGLNVAGQL